MYPSGTGSDCMVCILLYLPCTRQNKVLFLRSPELQGAECNQYMTLSLHNLQYNVGYKMCEMSPDGTGGLEVHTGGQHGM